MKAEPLWTDQVQPPDDLPIAVPPEQVDVAIVGAGYTGLNAARVLLHDGISVAVLERNLVGFGASGRNGGLATTGLKQSAQVIFRRYGPELGRAFWQASLDAIDLIEEIVEQEGIECDFVRPGHVALAHKPSHFESMRRQAVWYQRELGYRKSIVSRDQLRQEIGSDAFYGGLADEFSGGLHPAKYAYGLARAVVRAGGALCQETAVEELHIRPRGFELQTSRGRVKAQEVLIATNGYTDRLVPKLKPRVFPVGSYIIVTEPLTPEVQASLSPRDRMFYDSKWFLNYFRLTPDGRLLWGGRNDLSLDLNLEESAGRLRKQMLTVFPQLEGVGITHSWTGQLGLTFDLMPHIGRVKGVHYAFGYGGHGVSIATYLGQEVGALMCGKTATSPFAQIRHPTRFFYRNRPWFLPLAAFYYRLLDALS